MKGVVLAGGSGTRLDPLTRVTNKHLLPVYKKPMIYYPLKTMSALGIKDVLLISGRGHAGHFLDLLGSGKDFGLNLSYEVQEEAGGIAQALGLADDFSDGGRIAVILGDNIFGGIEELKKGLDTFQEESEGAKIFLKEVPNAGCFGVAEIHGNKILSIEEKPKQPKSNLIVTGLYAYDSKVFEVIKNLKPSARGELEITDVNNHYIKAETMKYQIINCEWTDAGTFDSLLRANNIAAKKK